MKRKFSLFICIVVLSIFSSNFTIFVKAENSRMVARKFTGIPKYLTSKTRAFELKVEILDQEHKAYQSIEPGSAYAVFESDEFKLEDNNELPVIKQLGQKDVQGCLRFVVTFKNVIYVGKSKTNSKDGNTNDTDNKLGSIGITVGYNVENTVVTGTVNITVQKDRSQIVSETNDTDSPAPRIELKKFSYPDVIHPGEKFKLYYSICNTSDKYKLENMIIRTDAGEMFIPTESNVSYVEELGCRGVFEKELSFRANQNAQATAYPIKLIFDTEYVEDGKRKPLKDEFVIQVPIIKEKPKLNLSLRVLPSSKEIDEGNSVEIKYWVNNATITNEGTIPPIAFNPTLEFKGGFEENSITELRNLTQGNPITNEISLTPLYKRNTGEGSTENLNKDGGIPAESTANADNTASATANIEANIGTSENSNAVVEQQIKEEEKPQIFKGEAILTYFDDEGHKNTLTRTFSFIVKPKEPELGGVADMQPQMGEALAPSEAPPVEKKSHAWIFITITAVVVIVVIIVAVKKAKAKRSFDADEDI